MRVSTMHFYESLCHVNTVRHFYKSLREFLGSNRLGRNPHETYTVLSMRVSLAKVHCIMGHPVKGL